MRKRILAYILAASMIITNGNMTVFAKEAAEEKIQQIEENTLAEERAEERLESETEIKESDSEKQTDTMSETEMSSETQSESSVTNMTDETQEEESVTNSGDEIQEEESVTGEVDEKEDEKTETKKQEETVLDNSIDEKSGQCGDNVYWTIDDEGKLTIYGTGDMWNYDSENSAPWPLRLLKSLCIENGVTSIGNYAFFNCRELRGDLIIPDSVTQIGNYAFFGCKGFIGKLIISNSVTSIGNYAFSGCSGLSQSLEIPGNVTQIGMGAFYDCSGFTGSLKIPNSVTQIGISAFYNCSGFTGKLIISNNLKDIEPSTFLGCSGFEGEVIIPKSVKKIESFAFSKCNGLSDIYISNKTNYIDDDAFSGIDNLCICGISGSFAEVYAKRLEIKFKVVDKSIWGEEPSEPEPSEPETYPEPLQVDNLSMIIETIDENVAISTTVNDSLESNVNVINDGKPRVLFFYDICDDVSVNKLKELHESSRLFYDVNLITIGSAYGVSQNGSYLISTISDFVSDFKRDDIIYGVRETFSSPSSKGILQEYYNKVFGTNTKYEEGDIELPFICYIDSNNKIQAYINGEMSCKTIENYIDYYCDTDNAIYTVEYVLNGGFNNSEKPLKFMPSNCPIALKSPIREGNYKFEGWYLDASFTNKITSIEKSMKQDLTLYGKWGYSEEYITYIANPIVELSENSIIVSVSGTYYTEDVDRILNRLNEIRFEACKEGINGLTEEDYVPLKWSAMLEGRSRLRAVECSLNPSHTRPNNQSSNSIRTDLDYYQENICAAENIVWGSKIMFSIMSGIEIWYQEKQELVNNTGNETGHYLKLIDKNARYVGIGNFRNSDQSCAVVLQTCDNQNLLESKNPNAYTTEQKIEIDYSSITDIYFEKDKKQICKNLSDSTVVWVNNVWLENGREFKTTNKWGEGGTWHSSDESIATVDQYGIITGLKEGTATISLTCGTKTASFEVEVKDMETCDITYNFDNGTSPLIYKVVKGKTAKLPNNPICDGYIFGGWFTDKNGKGIRFTEDTIITSNITVYAYWVAVDDYGDILPEDIPSDKIIPSGLWIAGVSEQTYTGSYIKPSVRVYDNKKLLVLNKDYTIAYKNNINANDASDKQKAPQIIVTGKGNYTGKEIATFKINPIDITKSDEIWIDNDTVAYNGKKQYPTPNVYFGNKKLVDIKDFIVLHYVFGDDESAYKDVGTYDAVIYGVHNYTGKKAIKINITDSKLISKATVSVIKAQKYNDGAEIKPNVTVKYSGKSLILNTDYTVSYKNNIKPGTASVVITGIGDYAGTKVVNFKINGTSIKNAKVSNLQSNLVYTGSEQIQNCVLTYNTVNLIENKDYVVSYQKNIDAGTATIIFNGINGYYGSLKKTFKIKGADIDNLSATVGDTVYAKSGAKAEPIVTDEHGKKLIKGKDYTLSYKDNKKLGNTAKVIIKGKGNYLGTKTLNFTVIKSDIYNLLISAPDKAYKNKRNAYKTTIKIIEPDGKVLSVGKDYVVTLSYKDGTEIGSNDIPEVGTEIKYEIKAKENSNYTGSISGMYVITKADFSKVRVTVKNQIYTGDEVKPGKDSITVKIGSSILSDDDYDIVAYGPNLINKGKNTITLKGVGNYGGTVTVKYTIGSKRFLWWR